MSYFKTKVVSIFHAISTTKTAKILLMSGQNKHCKKEDNPRAIHDHFEKIDRKSSPLFKLLYPESKFFDFKLCSVTSCPY